MHNRTSRLRRAVAAFSVGAAVLAVGATATAPAASAAECNRIFALVPSSQPSKDMSMGTANGTHQNAPLGLRDNSGLTRVEMWIELDGPGSSVYLQNVNTDKGTFVAASGGNFNGATGVTKRLNAADGTQRWTREQVTGTWRRYKDSSGRYLTLVAGDSSKPFQLYSSGIGDSYFKILPQNCY